MSDTFRRMTALELPLLTELEQACAHQPWSAEALRTALDDRFTHGWLLGDRAYCLERTVIDEAEILTLGVHPAARRLGVGRQLLEQVQQTWVDRGVVAAWLEVREANVPARGLYAQQGWRETTRRPHYYGPDEHAVCIRWSP